MGLRERTWFRIERSRIREGLERMQRSLKPKAERPLMEKGRYTLALRKAQTRAAPKAFTCAPRQVGQQMRF
jgi:hypothetical protein